MLFRSVPTKVQVACIASILLLIEYAACYIAQAALKGESGVSISAYVAAIFLALTAAILCFLPKLGLLRSRLHVICDWANVSSGVALFIFQGILSYQQSDYIMLALCGIGLFSIMILVMIAMYKKFVVATPPSLPQHLIGNTHNQSPVLFYGEMPPGKIWVIAVVAALYLIHSVSVAFTDDNVAVATLSAVQSIILAMLLVSCCIAETTPIVVAQDEHEPHAPLEHAAAQTIRDGDGNMA